MFQLRPWTALALGALLSGCAHGIEGQGFQPVTLDPGPRADELEPLRHAIGDRRIVLLGENGHGVGDFTAAKVQLVEWLHRELDFDVIVFESGFFECGEAWRSVAEWSVRELLYGCLKYPFQQDEIRPLFELIKRRHASDHPLELAGMDPQPQGFDSGARPTRLHAELSSIDSGLARSVAALDSALFLVPDSGGLGSDDLYPWILEHGAAAGAAYDSAADLSSGWSRWAFRLASGLVDRLAVRAETMAAGSSEWPASYYELRDEWMARAVAAVADSIAGPRKVVVWLHNDHARYGDFRVGSNRIRSTGGFLREWYGEDVFSVGFFMGDGVIADNARREREVADPIPGGVESFLAGDGHRAGYLLLAGNEDAAVREWADTSRPYLRMGIDPRELVPSEEFDALFYIDRVSPPDYSVRSVEAPPVRIRFLPDSTRFAPAAATYDSLWSAEGARIVRVMEEVSGLRFVSPEYADTAIDAVVLEAPSHSGYRDRPMRLRASYPVDTKVATLIHELGHRLQAGLFRRDEEEHPHLFLWLYDVWERLYGAEWADEQVAVEKRRGDRYVRAWESALARPAAERAARWADLVAERGAPAVPR